MRQRFVFKKSVYDFLQGRPSDQRLMLYDSILEYSFNGLEPHDTSTIKKDFNIVKKHLTKPKINVVSRDINTRKKEFQDKLRIHLDEFGKDMLNDFYKYWAEENSSGTLMKFEQQKTWETKLRLGRWSKNNFNNNPKLTASKKWREMLNNE